MSVGFGLGAPCVSFKVLVPPMPLGAGRHPCSDSPEEKEQQPHALPTAPVQINSLACLPGRGMHPDSVSFGFVPCTAPPPLNPTPQHPALWSSGWKGLPLAEGRVLSGLGSLVAVMSCQHPRGAGKGRVSWLSAFQHPTSPSPRGRGRQAGSWAWLRPGLAVD